jgi:hypothetical protein
MGLNPALCNDWQEPNHLCHDTVKMPLASGRWKDKISVEGFVLPTGYLISNRNKRSCICIVLWVV